LRLHWCTRPIALIPQHSKNLFHERARVVFKKVSELIEAVESNNWLRVLGRDERDDVIREDVCVGIEPRRC
jgi:hypothetical protein